jgi:hypothetical protein
MNASFHQTSQSSTQHSNPTFNQSVLHQGYLQYLQGDQGQKIFLTVTSNNICLFPEDPSKVPNLTPISVFNPQRVKLLDSGDFKRPKSFGLLTEKGVIEFSCPTNSVRTSWIKSISELSSSSAPSSTPKLDPAMELMYRTPVPMGKANPPPNNNRFSDFDGFASQTLNQLNAFKAGGSTGPSSSHQQQQQTAPRTISTIHSGPPAIRVPQPTHRAVPQPVPSRAFGETAASAARKGNTKNQQTPKELPKWVPGHFKNANTLGPKTNSSPQRARNVYSQMPPQPAATLLGRSQSAPNQQRQQQQAQQQSQHQEQHSLYQHPQSHQQQQQTQQQHLPMNVYQQPPPESMQHHHHTEQSNELNIPLEKMTLEQLRKAFMSMPSEVRSAILPEQHKPAPQQQQAELNRSARESRRPSYEQEPHRQKPRNNYQNPAEEYRNDKAPRRGTQSHHNNRTREDHEMERRGSKGAQRSREHRREQEYLSHSDDDDENRADHHHPTNRSRPHHQKVQHPIPTFSRDSEDERDRESYDHNENHLGVEYDDYNSHQSEEDGHRRSNKPTVAARLDYMDYDDEPEEEEEEENEDRRYERSDRREKSSRRETTSRSSPPKRLPQKDPHRPQQPVKKHPVAPVRSRSAPPLSSLYKEHQAPGPLPDFHSKKKSAVPREDLLEWSKSQAWQKHVNSDFPLSKEVYQNMNAAKGTSSSNRNKTADLESPEFPNQSLARKQSTKPSTNAPNVSSTRGKTATTPPAAAANYLKRSKSSEAEALQRRNAAATAAAAKKPEKRGSAVSANGMGSFFDFMKQRGAPVPQAATEEVKREETKRNFETSRPLEETMDPQKVKESQTKKPSLNEQYEKIRLMMANGKTNGVPVKAVPNYPPPRIANNHHSNNNLLKDEILFQKTTAPVDESSLSSATQSINQLPPIDRSQSKFSVLESY